MPQSHITRNFSVTQLQKEEVEYCSQNTHLGRLILTKSKRFVRVQDIIPKIEILIHVSTQRCGKCSLINKKKT